MAANVFRLANLIRREGVDLVHARSRAPAWVALGASRLTKRPFVTTYHGAYAGTTAVKTAYNSVMARGDVVIANSHFTARRILEMHPLAKGRVYTVHRGSDAETFSPRAVDPARIRALRESWEVQPGERVILLAARLTSWKGQRVLIDAAEILAKEGMHGVKYILAGDPQGRDAYARDLDAAIAKAGLEGIVRRVGHCSDMPAAYMAAAAVSVCSTDPEAFGRVAAEAQLFGKPLIVSDLGAVPETVLAPPDTPDSQRTGWKTPPGDAPALARALREVLDLRASDLDQLAIRARAHVAANFSLEQMCAQTLFLYAGLLEPDAGFTMANPPQRY